MRPDIRQPVFRQFQAQAENSPDARAIYSEQRWLSYGELSSRISTAAAALSGNFAVRPGDRVIVVAESGESFIRAYFAAHSTGAVCVPVSPQVAAARLTEIVGEVLPRLLISGKKISSLPVPAITFEELATAGKATGSTGNGVSIDVDQAADIMFTTGTTGRPKGVVLSHRALAAACSHINRFIGIRPDDVEVLPLPLGHSFGLGRVRCVLSSGASLEPVPGFVRAASIFDSLRNRAATGIASVPSGIAILLSDRGAALSQFSSQLRYIEIGSSAMPLEHKQLLMKALPNTRICMHYGLTEASRTAFLSFHDDEDRLDSIGQPSHGVQMRVMSDAGAAAESDAEGHIEVRGDHLFTAYWQDPDLTAATLRDGWMTTGDLGRRDADGFYYLKGRSSDVINVGGRNVAPQEIEAILATHPAIAECACVGIPDPQGVSGELISAFLVPNPEYEPLPKFPELAGLLRRSLEPYKIPRRFTWVGDLPRSPSGKLIRRLLKEPG